MVNQFLLGAAQGLSVWGVFSNVCEVRAGFILVVSCVASYYIWWPLFIAAGALCYFYVARGPQPPTLVPFLPEGSRVAVVTGGTYGLGQELVQRLEAIGYTVVVCARSSKQYPIDLADLKAVKEFCVSLRAKFPRIDLLVLNSGVWLSEPARSTCGTYNQTFAVNHLGNALFCQLLLPCLKKSSSPRVVVTSSCGAYGSSWGLTSSQWTSRFLRHFPTSIILPTTKAVYFISEYCDSKLANLLFARGLAARYPWLRVASCHPGFVLTHLVHQGSTIWRLLMSAFHPVSKCIAKTVSEGTETPYMCCVMRPEKIRSDVLYSDTAEASLPWQAQSQEDVDELWIATVKELQPYLDI